VAVAGHVDHHAGDVGHDQRGEEGRAAVEVEEVLVAVQVHQERVFADGEAHVGEDGAVAGAHALPQDVARDAGEDLRADHGAVHLGVVGDAAVDVQQERDGLPRLPVERHHGHELLHLRDAAVGGGGELVGLLVERAARP
jgi:hypothetical protein